MAITDTIKSILSVKLKPRHDTYTDQFSRIFLVKVLMISALLVGLNWYNEKADCIIPSKLGLDGKFAAQACWINGFYVYEEIRSHANEVGFYGIPRNARFDGRYQTGELCEVGGDQASRNRACMPMKKTFFLQYQYMTFVMAILAMFYYLPYAIFRLVNQDIASLKGTLKDSTADVIVNTYFNYKVNTISKLRIRILGNLGVKIIYIVVNVAAFIILDGLLNGVFRSYGPAWMNWSKLNNTMAYDYMGKRNYPKPGNELLPTFGFCEVFETAKDVLNTKINRHKIVCELSQHILYQYVFIILWFAMVFGIVVSVIGLLVQIIGHLVTVLCFQKAGNHARQMYNALTLRECEYLEFIRRKNVPVYGQVIEQLKKDRLGGLVNDHPAPYKNPDQYSL